MQGKALVAAVLIGWAGAAGLMAEPGARSDWPQFRGAARDGLASSQGLLHSWPAEGPKLLWRQPIGMGFASIVAVGDRLYTATSDADSEYAIALDANSGKELWRQKIGPLYVSDEFGSGTRASATVDGEMLYITSGTAQLNALKVADGAKVWSVDLLKDLNSQQPRFGYSVSPLVEGDLVIVEAGGADGKSLVAFDKKTGAMKWHALDGAASYSSPLAITVGKERHIVFVRRSAPQIVALRPDGTTAWTFEGFPQVIAMPVPVPPDAIFFSSTNDGAGFLMRLKEVDGKIVPEEVWRNHLMKNHFNASVVVGGMIYGFDNATFKCVDAATGQQKWASRGYGKGSVIAADGQLYVLTDDGRVALVEASPEAFKQIAIFQATTGKSWTPPTIANGRLYLRDLDEVAVYDLKGQA